MLNYTLFVIIVTVNNDAYYRRWYFDIPVPFVFWVSDLCLRCTRVQPYNKFQICMLITLKVLVLLSVLWGFELCFFLIIFLLIDQMF